MNDTSSQSEIHSPSSVNLLTERQGFWRRLKVNQRITLGFSLALGLTFAGTGTGIMVGNFYQHEALEVESHVREEIKLLSQLQTMVLQTRTHQQQLIPLSASPEAFKEEYSHILKHSAAINDVLGKLDAFIAETEKRNYSEATIDMLKVSDFLETYENVPETYLTELNQLASSIDIDSLEGAGQVEAVQEQWLAFTNSDLAISFDGISDDLTAIIESSKAELAIAREDAQAASRLRNWLIILSMVVSSGMATLLAWLISRSINAPLKAVEKTALAISENDNFDLRAEVMGEDEVGTVATAFNLLIQRVNDLLSEQTIKNQALEESNQQLVSTQGQMIEQEKLASLGSLTAGIAHEIKNPLNFVNNFAELSVELAEELTEELEAQKDQLDIDTFDEITDIIQTLKENVSKIDHHGKRADKIVANMLQHSRGGDSEWMKVDLNELVADAINLAYHGMRAKHSDFNLSFVNDYDDAVGAFYVSAQSLSRVFLNIASNACYATYQRQLGAGEDFKPLLKVRTRRHEDTVKIEIRDNGPGMSPEVKAKVFDQFFTTKPTGEGTGLGLSLSYNIVVEQHSGTMEVESEEGVYTDFIVTLPIKEEAE